MPGGETFEQAAPTDVVELYYSKSRIGGKDFSQLGACEKDYPGLGEHQGEPLDDYAYDGDICADSYAGQDEDLTDVFIDYEFIFLSSNAFCPAGDVISGRKMKSVEAVVKKTARGELAAV